MVDLTEELIREAIKTWKDFSKRNDKYRLEQILEDLNRFPLNEVKEDDTFR